MVGQELEGVRELFGGWISVQCDFPRGSNPCSGVCAGFSDDPLCEDRGLVEDEIIVHQGQRLRCDGGCGADFAVGFHPWQIECFEHADGAGTTGLEVDAAAEFFSVQRDDLSGWAACGIGRVDADNDLSVHIDHHGHGSAEHLWVEVSGGVEDGVAKRFGVDAAKVLSGEQSVFGVGGIGFCGVGGGLAIGGGVKDEALEVLEAPMVLGELGGEPVKEFGVRGSVSVFSKIAWGCDDPSAEEVVPDSVGEHAGEERMLAGGEVFGVSGPSSGGGGRFGWCGWAGDGLSAEHGEFGGIDLPPSLVGVAASVNGGFRGCLRRGGGLVEDRDEDLWRFLFPDFCDFLGEDLQLRFVFGFVGAVVEVERAWGELIDGGMLFEEGSLRGSARFGCGAVGGAKRFSERFRFLFQLPFKDVGDELILFEFPFGFDVFGTLFDLGGSGAFGIGHQGEEACGGGAPCGGVEAGFEDGAEGVVIGLQDRVVFVVVALCAAEGEAEESSGDDLERF